VLRNKPSPRPSPAPAGAGEGISLKKFFKFKNMVNKDFSKNLIKGKIAEIIFQQMWAEVGKYTILPLGYEKVFPGLIDKYYSKALKPIRSAPDFVLIPKDKNDDNIMIVEIKFRRRAEEYNRIKEVAKEQNKRWKPSYIFVATLKAFYFDKCDEILKNNTMSKLSTDIIPQKVQDKYAALLNSFIYK